LNGMDVKHTLTNTPNRRRRNDNSIDAAPFANLLNNLIDVLMRLSRRQRMIRRQIIIRINLLALHIPLILILHIQQDTRPRSMNQDGLLCRRGRSSLFEAREDAFGARYVIGAGGVDDDVELVGDVGEVGRVEVCDDGLDFCFGGEDVCAGLVADHGCDIVFVESEEVVEDLAADEPRGA
jgi:hypothetical protein